MYPGKTTFKTTSGPTTEPLTLDELKTRLRIGVCDFDSELQDQLKAARLAVETETNRRLITQTVELYLEDFPGQFGDIEIRLAPISAITHVKYYDQDDTLQTVASTSYYEDLTTTPPKIALKQSQHWPVTELYRPNKVIITFTAGYGAASAVPAVAKLAIVEHIRSVRCGCDGMSDKFKRLISELKWTEYQRVCV